MAPDGSPVAVYARVPVEPEFTPVLDRLQGGDSVLDLGCGAGRLADELARRGHDVVGVDESPAMLGQLSEQVSPVRSSIEDLRLRRRFDTVVLASYLVNTPDADRRGRLLASCARHVAADGQVLLSRYDRDWARQLTSERATAGGVHMHLELIERRGSELDLSTTFELGGDRWRHTRTVRILDDDELAAALADHGLRMAETIGSWWVVARPRDGA